MRLHIRNRGIEVTEQVWRSITERLNTDFEPLAPFVSEVWVYLHDVNGPRGGGMNCRIVAHVPGTGEAVVESTGMDLRTAVKHASERVWFTLQRQLQRKLTLRRRSRRRAENSLA
jgi:ribosome-associated translation inhibitor RaiA